MTLCNAAPPYAEEEGMRCTVFCADTAPGAVALRDNSHLSMGRAGQGRAGPGRISKVF